MKALLIALSLISTVSFASYIIQNGSVTQVKLAPRPKATPAPSATPAPVGNVAVSASCGTFATSSGSFVAVTNLSVTLTTTGRPVYVTLAGDGTSNAASVGPSGGSATTIGYLDIVRNATVIGHFFLESVATGAAVSIFYPPGSFNTVDIVSAGTYTYTIQVLAGTLNMDVNNTVLVAYEL